MHSAGLISAILPYFLMIVMLGVGMSLTLGDFKRVVVEPAAAAVGIGGQLLLLPAIAFLLGFLLDPPPELAVGIILLAACPGGPVSNLFTYLARGDAALSVSLTAFSNFVTAVTLPIVTGWGLSIHFAGEASEAPEMPLLATSLRIFVLTVLPVLAGLAIRRWTPRMAGAVEPWINRFAAVAVVILLFYIFYSERSHLLELMSASGGAVVLFLLLTIASALVLGALARLPRPQRIAMVFELGFQNAVLGFTIALTILGSAEIAIPLGLYTIVSTSVLTLILVGLRLRPSTAAAIPGEVR